MTRLDNETLFHAIGSAENRALYIISKLRPVKAGEEIAIRKAEMRAAFKKLYDVLAELTEEASDEG